MFNQKEINNIYDEGLRKSALKVSLGALVDSDSSINDKIIRRLHTCTYDIEKIAGKYYIYMSGLKNNALVYFNFGDKEAELIWNRLLNSFQNCEIKYYYNRMIAFMSYEYIRNKIALKHPIKHNRLKTFMNDFNKISDKVSVYLKKANELRIFWNEKEYLNLLDMQCNTIYVTNDVFQFIKENLIYFFIYDKQQYIYGKELNRVFVKFSFSENKKNKFSRGLDGKYYKYFENKIAEDYFDGSGFSFGELDKAFFYFQYGNYGEQLMFVRTLPDEKYYQQTYEYLGRKLKIEKIDGMNNVDNIKIILMNMSDEAKKSFFTDFTSESFEKSYGSVTIVINKMKEYDQQNLNKIYAEAIEFLLSERKKYISQNNL